MPVHVAGPEVKSLTYLSDWQPVSGLIIPFAGEERRAGTGEAMNRLKWDVIGLNVAIRRADILPPGR